QRHNIPTAHYTVWATEEEIRKSLGLFSLPVVVRADGLAAGKGVGIAATKDEAATVGGVTLSGKILGLAAMRGVIEGMLRSDRLSFLVLSDAERVPTLVATQNHRRIGEGDSGANTGGMGAYSIDTLADEAMVEWLLNHIARPVVQGMKSEGVEYRGILYCGLM